MELFDPNPTDAWLNPPKVKVENPFDGPVLYDGCSDIFEDEGLPETTNPSTTIQTHDPNGQADDGYGRTSQEDLDRYHQSASAELDALIDDGMSGYNQSEQTSERTIDPEQILGKLNEQQRSAAQTSDQPTLIVASAGTGKTTTVVAKIALDIAIRDIPPEQMLAVTFTNKAAGELRDRIYKATKCRTPKACGTFHSVASRILRKDSQVIGIPNNFTIVDSDDAATIFAQAIEDCGLREIVKTKDVKPIVDALKDRGYTPDLWKRHPFNPKSQKNVIFDAVDAAHYLAVWKDYEQGLRDKNALDFADLINKAIDLLQTDSPEARDWRKKFTHIYVDEYQDISKRQQIFIDLLVNNVNGLTCVGDDDQSIYRWRNAEPQIMLSFAKRYPNAKIVQLGVNYRCPQSIVRAAAAVIGRNKDRYKKEIISNSKESPPINVVSAADDDVESAFIAKSIKRVLSTEELKAQPSDIAILVRTARLTRVIEEQLIRQSIPYVIVGGLGFWQREEIKDALAYLRLVTNPNDNIAFERIANKPARGIGAKTMTTIRLYAKTHQMSAFRAAMKLIGDENEFNKKTRAGLRSLIALIHDHATRSFDNNGRLLDSVIKNSGYETWLDENHQNAGERKENIQELAFVASQYKEVQDLAEHAALTADRTSQKKANAVKISTIHAAKGLEWHYVYLPAWEERIFPNRRAVDEREGGVEEERNLAFVALTRAGKRVCISHADNRNGQSNARSRFIEEIPIDLIVPHRQELPN